MQYVNTQQSGMIGGNIPEPSRPSVTDLLERLENTVSEVAASAESLSDRIQGVVGRSLESASVKSVQSAGMAGTVERAIERAECAMRALASLHTRL